MVFKGKLQANGLATIPSVVQKQLGASAGDYLEFEIIIKKGKPLVVVRKAEKENEQI